MISYAVYKVIHLMGVLMVFLAMGGAATHAINKGTKAHDWRKGIAITHGIGMFVSLLGGFGLMARLGIAHGGFPGWIWAKLLIWAIFGALIAVFLRKPTWSKGLWPAMILLGGLAAYFAGSKSF